MYSIYLFKSNPSFISASRVDLLLYEKFHLSLIYENQNFNAALPPSYIYEDWDYKNVKVENVQRSVSEGK